MPWEDVVPLTKMDYKVEKQIYRSVWREEIPDEIYFEMSAERRHLHSCSIETGDVKVVWERS